MIVDTTFLIDVLVGETDTLAKLEHLTKKNEPLLTTPLSIFELHTGIARSSKPEQEKQQVASVLNDILTVPLDDVSAARAGQLHGTAIKKGKPLSVMDTLIAGIALERDEPVLTRNRKDFARVPGLRVETY